MAADPSFLRLGPETPNSPIIVSVPHAGRNYPAAFATLARLHASRLRGLEDRYADCLVPDGACALVAQTARVWIDLNRSERDVDPRLIRGSHATQVLSAKVRGGLGVVPRRLAVEGDIWRGTISGADFAARLEQHHRPFHRALASLIDLALARFGVAVLIDLHSMPSLAGADAPRYVVGDMFGRSAQARFAQTALEVLGEAGATAALNAPYAGGHILERHARPHGNVHALQIEVDRSLYLDAALDRPVASAQAVEAKLAALVAALAAEALAQALPIAAE